MVYEKTFNTKERYNGIEKALEKTAILQIQAQVPLITWHVNGLNT